MLIELDDGISEEETCTVFQSTCPRVVHTCDSSVTSNLSSHRLGASSATQLSTSVLSAILPSIPHPARFSVLLYQTQPSGRISAQPWSVIKGWLWSAASQTLHKLPHMFYSVLFQHLNYNFLPQKHCFCVYVYVLQLGQRCLDRTDTNELCTNKGH